MIVVSFAPANVFAFGPCAKKIPADVSYAPSLAQCGGKAAIVLSGELKNSFSVVVRACDNGDRDPCYSSITSCGTNASSPFKVQKTIDAVINRKGVEMSAKIHCLKEAGNSSVYRMVRRMTIKRVNPVRNPSKDVFKICLPSRTRVFNSFSVVSTGKVTLAGNTGFNQACLTQRYLGCNLDAVLDRICPMN
jgi:hypothetical protein